MRAWAAAGRCRSREPERPQGDIGLGLALGHPLHGDEAIAGPALDEAVADEPAPDGDACRQEELGEQGGEQLLGVTAVLVRHAQGSAPVGVVVNNLPTTFVAHRGRAH